MGWLNNILDRACLKYLCQAGGYLYQEDLAHHIQEVFTDCFSEADEEHTDDAIALTDDES